MRKLFCTGLLLGVLSLVFGSAPAASAANFSNCTYQCTCSGQALKCCGTPQVCQPTSELGCPQVYNC
jgi:hypothetical protein